MNLSGIPAGLDTSSEAPVLDRLRTMPFDGAPADELNRSGSKDVEPGCSPTFDHRIEIRQNPKESINGQGASTEH
jgi:hypothetical protein